MSPGPDCYSKTSLPGPLCIGHEYPTPRRVEKGQVWEGYLVAIEVIIGPIVTIVTNTRNQLRTGLMCGWQPKAALVSSKLKTHPS